MSRSSSLHPFTRRVALAAGGFAVVVSTILLVWARSRLPTAADLERRVHIELAVPGQPALADGAQLSADRPIEVRYRHDLVRPLGLVVVAEAEGQPPRWLVPADPAQKALQVKATEALQARVVGTLPAGRWRVEAVVGIEDGAPAAEWRGRSLGRRVWSVEVK